MLPDGTVTVWLSGAEGLYRRARAILELEPGAPDELAARWRSSLLTGLSACVFPGLIAAAPALVAVGMGYGLSLR